MGYRNQSGDSQFRGSTQPQQDNIGQQIVGSAIDVFGTELINIGKANRLRKEVNTQLAQESKKNQQLLMSEIGGFGKVEGGSLADGPDPKNLQDEFTPIVSELSKAQLNLSQHGSATYTYKYIDPVTGEESMRNREDDEATVDYNKNLIRSAQDLIGATEYNIGVIETVIEENKIGNGRGETPLDSIDPYVYAVALSGSALNGQNIKERYFFEKDENGNRVMMVEYKGQSIAQVNKARGIEGDTHVTNLKRLAEIQSSGSSLANNAGGSNTAHDYTDHTNQSLQKSGVFDEESQFKQEFYIAGENFNEVDGRTRTTYNTKSFDYNQAIQSTDAISKTFSDQSVRGGPDQTLIDMRAYSVQTTDPKTGEVMFSIVPGPEIDADGLVMYDEKKNPIMKDPIRLLDEDGVFIQENFPTKTGHRYQEIEEVLKDVMQQSILLDGGAYSQQEKTRVTSSVIPDSDDSGGDGKDEEDTSMFQILSTTTEDDSDSFMLGGEDRVFEIKNLSLGTDVDAKFSGIGRDGEGPYVIISGKKDRSDKSYNFYKNAVIESVDKNEKPSVLARFEELEEMTPSGSISIESVVNTIVNEAKKKEYQNIGTFVDDDNEKKFADYLEGLGFELINEEDLNDVSFDDNTEMTRYIKDKIFESNKNKDVARKMSGSGAGANKKETPTERAARILKETK